eukprot:PhF_6_TR19215/c0_g1_i1/m.28248
MIPRLFCLQGDSKISCVSSMVNGVTRELRKGGPSSSLDASFVTGFQSSCLAFAFASGYQCAMYALYKKNGVHNMLLPPQKSDCDADHAFPAAICVTENVRPPSPKSITCRVSKEGLVSGEKSFITCGSEARSLLILARTHSEVLELKAVHVRPSPGNNNSILMQALPPLSFCAEVSHSKAQFNNSPGEILPGDGFRSYMRPFRSIEDVHVASAIVGHLIGLSQQHPSAVSHSAIKELATVGAALVGAGNEILNSTCDDVTENSVHLVLSGIHTAVQLVARKLAQEIAISNTIVGEKLLKDLPLLHVAEAVRKNRFEKAVTVCYHH